VFIIKVHGKMVNKTVLVLLSILKEHSIKVTSPMENLWEKEYIFIQMDHIIKETLSMVCMKDKGCFGIKKINLHMKDNGKEENLMEMENKLFQGLEFMKVAS
jgi:hypothetical protein